VNGKPNFCPVAWTTLIDNEPPMIGLVMDKKRHTRAGISANGVFSVNLPSTSQAAETDYCGLVSGEGADKSGVFKVTYGSLAKAPLIEEAPVSIECKLLRTVEFETTDMIIGEIVDVHVSKAAVNSEGDIDASALDLMTYVCTVGYYPLGPEIGKAYDLGRKIKPVSPVQK